MHISLRSLVTMVGITGMVGTASWLPNHALADDNTKTSMIAFFMETGCPTGWSVYEPAQGRLLLGVTDSAAFTIGSQGGGDALENEENRTHTHSYSTSVDVGKKNIEADGGDNHQGSSPGNKSVPETPPGTTAAASSNTPLAQLTVCEKTAAPSDPSAPDPYPQGALAFFNTKTCPAGSDPNNPDWQSAPLDMNDKGYFLVPFYQPPAATLAALVGTGLSPGEDHTHTHAFSSSITLSAVEYAGKWGCVSWLGLCHGVTSSGQKNFSGTSGGSSSGLSYVTQLLCQKMSFAPLSNPPQNIPTSVVTFVTAETCPAGWKMTEATTGRYLVGLPDEGVPGATFGGDPLNPTETAPTPVADHDHGFSGKVSTGNTGVALASGCCAHDAGGAGTYDYTGTSGQETAGLPYVGVIQCQPCTQGDTDPECQTN